MKLVSFSLDSIDGNGFDEPRYGEVDADIHRKGTSSSGSTAGAKNVRRTRSSFHHKDHTRILENPHSPHLIYIYIYLFIAFVSVAV